MKLTHNDGKFQYQRTFENLTSKTFWNNKHYLKAWLLVTDGCLPKCDFGKQSCIWTTRENKGQRNNIISKGEKCDGQIVSILFKGKNDIILWWVIIVDKCVNYFRIVTI